MSADRFDVIIIGTGAGGGAMALRLAPSGKRILLLERGGFLPRERENWDEKEVAEKGRYQSGETWLDGAGAPFKPYTHYCVGGNTKVYGAALLRLRESDFGEVRHFGGVSPAWPIAYSDLEPFYTEAERLYCVRGLRGADPHDPRASAPYPRPPLEHEPRIRKLAEELRAIGLRPFPIPIGLRDRAGSPGEAPLTLDRFDGYPDPTETKADAHVCTVRPALEHSSVTLLTGAYVERLETDRAGGRVERVVVVRDGKREVFEGGVVVLACGAINSAALLLRSTSDRHPQGLANSSGLVGRNYMTHHNALFVAVTEEPNPSRFQKTLGLTDFYRGDESTDLPLGVAQLMGKLDRASLAGLAGQAMPGIDLGWIGERTIDFFLTAEDLPSRENRITLDADGAIRVHYAPTNMQALERLESRMRRTFEMLDERTRAKRPTGFLTARLGVSGVSHQCGTLRFGADPRASVLDVDCRAHDLENLYACDGSVFPSSGAVNPSLTIIANALRVGDRIAEALS
jgi:choline dehydrogenase-like flavoprotein